jgi:chromosome segregation ATPase
MSEDLNNNLRPNNDDNIRLVLTAVQELTFRVGRSEQKFDDFAERIDRRLQSVSSDIAQLQEGQRRLEEGQKRLRSDLTDFRRHVDQQFRTLSGEVERRYREHDQRIARLETNANPPNTET